MAVVAVSLSGQTWQRPAAGSAASASVVGATPAASPAGEARLALGQRVVAAVEGAGSYRFERYDVVGDQRRLVRSGEVDLEQGARFVVAGSRVTIYDFGDVRYLRSADGRWERGPAGEPDALLLILDELRRGEGGWQPVADDRLAGEGTEVLRSTEPVALAETTAEERTLWVDAETGLPRRYRERGNGPVGPYELETEFVAFGQPVDLGLPPAALASPAAPTATGGE